MADKPIEVHVPKGLLTLSPKVKKAAIKILRTVGMVVQREAKQNHNYVDRSQNLTNSIVVDKVNKADLSINVKAGMEYGKFLERGTKYIKARYFLRNAKDKKKKEILTLIDNAIKRAMR